MSKLKKHEVSEVSEASIKKAPSKTDRKIYKQKSNASKRDSKDSHNDETKFCNNEHRPISNRSCLKCKNDGHHDCLSNSKIVDEKVKIVTLHNLDEDTFTSEWTLGKVPPTSSIQKSKSVWLIPLKLSNKITIFKIDTGASVTVIPLTVYESLNLGEMQLTDIAIFGASGHALEVVGQITTTISRLGSNKSVLCTISVIKGLQQSLLGLEEITALNLVSLNLDEKNEETTEVVEKHDKLEIKDKSPKNRPKSFMSKTQCWQDEFQSPYLELGGASYCISKAMPFPMLWMAGMVDFDNHSKEGLSKNFQKRKFKHKRHNNTNAVANYDSIFLTFLLKEMIPTHEPSISSRQGSNQLTWSRHS